MNVSTNMYYENTSGQWRRLRPPLSGKETADQSGKNRFRFALLPFFHCPGLEHYPDEQGKKVAASSFQPEAVGSTGVAVWQSSDELCLTVSLDPCFFRVLIPGSWVIVTKGVRIWKRKVLG